MKIVGYSERGIINSLVFSISEHENELMTAFIKQIELPYKIDIGEPDNYEILLEQSFSQFGDSDLVIIANYKNPSDKKVLFFEGKVKTWGVKNWIISKQYIKHNSPVKYYGYSSNLFFQLKSKELLVKNLNGIFEIDKYEKYRKLGDNGVVLLAAEKIKLASGYFYIGIIPSTETQIKDFLEKEYKDELPIKLLAWETVERFCENMKLQKVLDMFAYNKGQIY
jgi:hypothetical protein